MSPGRGETLPASRLALFRYRLVSEVRARVLAGTKPAAAVGEVASRSHLDRDERLRHVTARSLYRWLAAYEKHGFAGLEPKPRRRSESSDALSQRLLRFFATEKAKDRDASIPELIRRARRDGVIGDDEPISRVTAWRACRRLGLPVSRRRQPAEADVRAFGYPNRLMMLLADGKHFSAGAQRRGRVALTILDDATRFGLAVLVGTNEDTALFLTALYEAIRHHGLMDALYLDNGPGFISDDTHSVFAQLDRHLIHGTAGYPEGRGKIERFNRTFKEQLLRGLAGNPAVDPDPGALTLRLSHWLSSVYNHTPHEGLGGDTPAERWHADERALVFPDPAWLRARFLVSTTRRVTKHNLVPYNGVDYEVPRGHAGERLTIYRHLLEPDEVVDDAERLSIVHDGRRVFLAPVDRIDNAYSRRGSGRPPEDLPSPENPPPFTAADRGFSRDFEPILDEDGGFPEQASDPATTKGDPR